MRTWKAFSIAGSVIAAMAHPAAAQEIRFVPDVVTQFNALTDRADAMGFELFGPDPSQCRHMQGVVRVDAPDGTPYLLVSRSGKDTGVFCLPGSGSERANVYVVRMGSRDKNGERLRSNRLRPGMETTDTPPETDDRVVKTLLFDGTTEWPHYEHPGGMQLVGNVLALALESGKSGQPSTKIQFIDVTNPEEPGMLSSFNPPLDQAGVVGLTPCGLGREGVPCETGHYLMLISGGDNDDLRFYESTGTDLKDPNLHWKPLYDWHKDELIGGEWPPKHQTLHLLREGKLDGRLFLAGARAVDTVEGLFGRDYIDLYEVGFEGEKVTLTHRSTRHMISHPTGEGNYIVDDVLYGGRLASFAAASGFHVTPTGELIFYATEHDNDGPEGSNDRASVKFGEWRHTDMFRPNSPAYAPTLAAPGPVTLDEGSTVPLSATAGPPIARPWIQLFQEVDFRATSRFVVVDLADYDKDDFDNFGSLDRGHEDDDQRFNNRAAAWRWFAPRGCIILANDLPVDETGFPGPVTKTLIGTGQRFVAPNLHGVVPDNGVGEMFREVGSAQFSTSCDDYYAIPILVRWDLNFDGAPETGGSSITLSAAELDGPASLGLLVQAQHPVDDRVAARTVPVTVRNVNPTIQSWRLMTISGRQIGVDVPFAVRGQTVRGLATFTDPGRLDTQGALVDWGDGTTTQSFTTFNDAYGGVEGRLEGQHAYAIPDVYAVGVVVKDDDNGATDSSVPLTVVTPAAAVSKAIALLDALIATTSDPALKHLLAARSSLAGAGRSGDPSGALAKVADEQNAAAIAHLRTAIRHLDGASSLAGVSAIVAILEEIASALAG